jgi:hypothetical protein
MSALHAALDLPPAPRSVPTARRVVAQLLTAWAAEAYSDDAALLVSELVTHVVRHVPGDAAMTVEVHLTPSALQVAVVDGCTTLADVRPPTAQGGHGLWLIAAVADRWGSEKHVRGKRVWFELRATG